MINKKSLIQFILENKILTFGDFVTNSGRKTPYFCNYGFLSTAKKVRDLSDFYADKIISCFGSEVSNVFGPAYKGISLAIMVADSLSTKLGKEVSFTFNRKEAKDHGEKGLFLGHSYKGGEKVVIVEDVITSGKSLFSARSLLSSVDINVLGSVVCIDREESALNGKDKARDSFIKETKTPLEALITVTDLFKTLEGEKTLRHNFNLDESIFSKVKGYQQNYF